MIDFINKLIVLGQTGPTTIGRPPGLPAPPATDTTIDTVLNTLFLIMGAVAVLIITIAGFKYVLSRGDPQATAKAKDTILYALIGLVVIVAAYTIVTFAVRNIA